MNHAPLMPCFDVYRTYAGLPIALPIAATDPEGGALRYTAEMLPEGALLDEQTGVLSWTPGVEQLGPYEVHITVADDGVPPLSAETDLVFQVYPLDLNANVPGCVPLCDPAAGCSGSLPVLTKNCCPREAQVHVAEPLPACPAGRVLFVGRNTDVGFGRLQPCDVLPVANQGQIGASIRINIEARCVNTARAATLHVFMETKLRRPLLDFRTTVSLDPGTDGYAQRAAVIVPVSSPGPFFDLDGAEGNLTLTLTDADGVVVSQQLRLTLVNPQPPDPLPNDLQDVADVPVGLATCSNIVQDVDR